MHRILAAVLGLLLAFPALAQTRIGPLVIQNALGEIAANGTQATARANLGLPLGTSGATVPLLSGANTWSGLQTFGGGGTGLAVVNDATVGGNLTVTGTITGAGGSFLPLAGGTLTGPLTSAFSGAFSTLSSASNATVGGTLGVTGAATFGSAFVNKSFDLTGAGVSSPANEAFGSFVTYSGTPTTPATYAYHFFIANDTVHFTPDSNTVNGYYQLKLNTGFTGNRIGLGSSVAVFGSPGAPTPGWQIALWGDMTGAASQGGTGLTPGTSAGSIWAGLLNASLSASATNYALYQGLEIDMNGVGTTMRKHGLQISLAPTDINRGALFDAAFVIGNPTGTVGSWKHGILLSEDSSQWPFASDSSLIKALMGQNDNVAPAVAAFGVDLVDVAFGTAAFRTNGLSVDGSGNEQIGTGYLQPVTAGLTIDTKGAVGNTANGAGMIVSGGSGWSGGEVLTDPWGGRYKVSGTAAGVITALTVYRQPIFPTTTTPANPVTLGLRSGTTSVAPTINISWNTTGNTLSLQPTGGTLKLGSTLMTANGAVATALSSIGPTGSHTTVQEWLTVTNAAGAIRYIPAF